jgi:hypothetical protein
MTGDDIEQALDRFGGNLAQWPAALRAEAESLIARDPVIRARFDEARHLEALLAEAVAPVPVDAASIGRIVATAQGQRREVMFRPGPRFAAWASAALVALFVIGFSTGLAVSPVNGDDMEFAFVLGGGDLGGLL